MRLLQLGLLLALASGLTAILIYITGVSNLCTYIYSCVFFCIFVVFNLNVIVLCVDKSQPLDEEDFQAMKALQTHFRKCVVSFSFS